MDLAGGADAGLEGALDPGVVQRAVLAGEVDPALGADDVGLELGLLLGREHGEGAAGPSVSVPGVRGSDLVHLADAGVDARDVVERLFLARLVVHGAPLQRVLAPRVRGEQHASRGARIGGRVVHAADRQVGHGATAMDAVLGLPDALADLEQDLRRGVVVQLPDRPLLPV